MEEPSTSVGSSSESTAKEFLAEVEKDVLAFRLKMLLASLNARQGEIAFLQSRLRRSAFQEKVLEIISRRYEELVALHNEDPTATTLANKKDSSFFVMEKGLLTQDIFTYATRLVDIAGGKAIAELDTALSKMKLKDAAKDPQQGPAITQDSLADTVRKAVQEALQKEKGEQLVKSNGKRNHADSNCINSRHEEKRQRKGRECKGQECIRRLHKESPERGQAEAFRLHSRHLSDEGEEAKEPEKGSEGTWTWSNPSAYPDRLLNIPFNQAVMEICQRMPLALLDSLRYRQAVHLLEGVHVSSEMEQVVSKGFRYLFSQKINSSIVLRDYEHFCNTIRWKVFFHGKDSKAYDQRYKLGDDRPLSAPKAPMPVEAGLAEGRSRIMRMIEEAP